jgi:Fe-S-cluster containining protein
MLNINCKDCGGVCCTSKKGKLFVVLIPQEIDKFEGLYEKFKTKHGELNILKQDEIGNCIFHDEEKNICKTYSNRPFECTTYPYMIHFDKDITFKLESICPKIKNCSPNELKKTEQEWLKQNLPLSWIKSYSEIFFREDDKYSVIRQ